MYFKRLSIAIVSAISMASGAIAATATLEANSVIIDNAPFDNNGVEDTPSGSGNFALNLGGAFKDIPYAIFSFGGATSVSSATLNWDYLGPYLNSTPTSITLYGDTDADGIISVSDVLGAGTAVDTSVYLAAQTKSFDVTALVNNALSSSGLFAAWLEVDADPLTFSGYLGGQFGAPSLTFEAGAGPSEVPLPAGLPLLLVGCGALAIVRRRKKAA